MKQNYRADIAILRLLAILAVVAFHAYGMCYAPAHLPSPLPQRYGDVYERFNQCGPINVAMPLFIFISGFLFFMQQAKGRYSSLFDVAKDKLARLCVPYYVFMVLMMATYSGFSWDVFYTGSYWHLWFLPALWWCFIVTYLLSPIIHEGKWWQNIGLLCILAGCMLVGRFLPHVFGLHYLNEMLYWFVLGACYCRYENKMDRIFSSAYLVVPLLVVYLVTLLWSPTEYGDQTLSFLVGSTSGILFLCYVFRRIAWQTFAVTPFLLSIVSCCYGVYIFHNWIEVFLVSSTAQRLLPVASFAEHYVWLFPFLFTLSAFLVSVVLSKLLLMTRVGRMLIG